MAGDNDRSDITPEARGQAADRALNARASRRVIIGGAGALIIGGVGAGSGVFAHGGDDDDDHSGPGGGGDDDDHHGLPPEQSTQVANVTTVHIIDERFEPNNILIETGQTVTWVNQDDDRHTASGRGMDTGVIDPGKEGTVTFLEPGEFRYTCNFHPEMLGLVTVTGESKATPEASPVGTPSAAPMQVDVKIVDFAFDPEKATIAVGGTVTWTNTAQTPHTIYADWAKSDILNTGDTFEHTFDKPGAYEYKCGLHPAMVGTIEVIQGDRATPEASPSIAVEGEWDIAFTMDRPDVLPLVHSRDIVGPDGWFKPALDLGGEMPVSRVWAYGEWWHENGKAGRRWGISIKHEVIGRTQIGPIFLSEYDETRVTIFEDLERVWDGGYESVLRAHVRRSSGPKIVVSGTAIGRKVMS